MSDSLKPALELAWKQLGKAVCDNEFSVEKANTYIDTFAAEEQKQQAQLLAEKYRRLLESADKVDGLSQEASLYRALFRAHLRRTEAALMARAR